MSRRVQKIAVPLVLLVVTLGLYLHFASNERRVILEQSVSGTYLITPSDLASHTPQNLTEEDQNSIENLLQCVLKVKREPRNPEQLEITVTVADTRPAIAVHRKAVDLVTVVLREQTVAFLEGQLLELERYRDQSEKLDWLESQERLLQNKLELAESGFFLKKTSHFRSHSNAISTLIPIPFLAAATFSLLLLLRGILDLRAAHSSTAVRGAFQRNVTSEDELGPSTSVWESVSSGGGAVPAVLEEIERELTRAESKNILILGDPVHGTKTDFTLKFAHYLSTQGRKVHLVDFDLRSRNLSSRLGREYSLGVSDFLVHGGPSTEFSSSLTGLEVIFTPAGQIDTINENASERRVREYFKAPEKGVLLIEASKTSPLHLIIHQVEGVLYVDPRRPSEEADSPELQVLLAFREARIPVWAVSTERHSFFPMI